MTFPLSPLRIALVASALSALACSSSKSDGAGSAAPGSDAGNGGNLVGSDALVLDPPDPGFQLKTIGTMIDPGDDTEYCEIVAVPGDASQIYKVDDIDILMAKHSHHLIISTVDETNPAYAGLEVGNIQHCFGAQELVGIVGATMVSGSQLPHIDHKFPAGVGLEFHGGQKLIFDYHYYNTETVAIHTGHKVNFHTVDSLDHIGKTLGFYNVTIDTPPGQSGKFTAECNFSADVVVGQLTRHTHQWGTDFSVSYSGGENDGQHIWTSKNYESDTEHTFEPPVLMKQGTGFQFECDFQNDTSRNLTFGLKATDEMCILFGLYWEPTSTPVAPQFCMIMDAAPDGGVAHGGSFRFPSGDGGLPIPAN